MRARLLLPLLLLSGCALDSGEGFAVLEPTVGASYSPLPSRDAGGGFQRLASDFQVRLDAAAVGVDHVALLTSGSSGGGGGGGGTFDPANPPPGYSLCHNGHCHRDDGALVDYEDIQAEMNGGGGSAPTTVAALHVDDELDLLAAESRSPECEPDCELPRGTVSRGRWDVTALRLQGVVRDSRVPSRFPGELPFRLDLAVEGGEEGEEAEPLVTLDSALDIPSDRENKPRVILKMALVVTPALFDGLDLSNITPGADGVVDLGAPQYEALRRELLESLAELPPQVEVRREDR
ncbi:hypothetical protein HPC49_46710 [Pyxidicoccus fallax]|uniref:Lipoprotein n=1 Tax=Pyxidicoccus fallax TaxID=394095 RepID=A0A848LMN3_9BACT|nr:hypothetical protein [Pyxidicoccus fallax]NMO18996.1 hypothetical protein [Pyxidicoccus fallax]NPC85669.1 hypothetical protein [Pyxidicoccus fallax]